MNWQQARLGLVAGSLQRAGIGSVRPRQARATSAAKGSANSSISDSRTASTESISGDSSASRNTESAGRQPPGPDVT
jgi:hypothetical protein